ERIDLDVGNSVELVDVLHALPKADRLTAAPEGGQPVTISLHDANINDVLCMLSQVGQREILVPRDLQRRVTIFANDVPINALVAKLAPQSGDLSACKAQHDSPSSRLKAARQVKLEEIGVGDLRMAAIARVGKEWQAYAYIPGGRLVSLEPGARFFDGAVK